MKLTTQEIAEHMQASGKFYTAAMLVQELGINFDQASGCLYCIRKAKRYQTTETPLPGRTVKVFDIDNRKHTTDLWKLALFGNSKEAA